MEYDVFEPKVEWDGVPKPVTSREPRKKEVEDEVPEPIIKDEDPNGDKEESDQIDSSSRVVAKVEEMDVVPEVYDVDHLLEIKNWAM